MAAPQHGANAQSVGGSSSSSSSVSSSPPPSSSSAAPPLRIIEFENGRVVHLDEFCDLSAQNTVRRKIDLIVAATKRHNEKEGISSDIGSESYPLSQMARHPAVFSAVVMLSTQCLFSMFCECAWNSLELVQGYSSNFCLCHWLAQGSRHWDRQRDGPHLQSVVSRQLDSEVPARHRVERGGRPQLHGPSRA